MSPRPLTESELVEAVTARAAHGGNICAAARAMNVSENCLRNRLKHAAERGMLGHGAVLPGFAIKSVASKGDDGSWVKQTREPGEVFEVPADHRVAALSVLTDGSGREMARWTKTKVEPSAIDIAAAVKAAFEGWTPRAVASAAPACDGELATVYVCNDWHVGLLCAAEEVGEAWDTKRAQRVIGESIARLVSASPSSKQGVVLGLGDLLHADGYDHRTPQSKNPLDVDGRYPLILKAATRLLMTAVSEALKKHETVLVRVLAGNHDVESSVAVSLALSMFYSDDPRVTVDDSPSRFWWWEWGSTFLGATHGDGAKMKDLPLVMATRNPQAWGRSQHRTVLTGHVHHASAIEISGVTVESFQAPVPADHWHHLEGYGAGRSLTSITYHREHGEVGRNKVYILPPPVAKPTRRAA